MRIRDEYASRDLSEVRVSQIEPGSDPRWDEFVSAEPDGLVYQHSGWLRCLEAEYERPVIGLCTEDENGALTGVLPLVATRGFPLLRRSDDRRSPAVVAAAHAGGGAAGARPQSAAALLAPPSSARRREAARGSRSNARRRTSMASWPKSAARSGATPTC